MCTCAKSSGDGSLDNTGSRGGVGGGWGVNRTFLAESTLPTPPSGSIVGAECSDDDGINVVVAAAVATVVVAAAAAAAAAAVDVSVVVVAVVIDSVVAFASVASGRGFSSDGACDLAAGVAGTSMTVTASTAALPVTSAAVKSDGRGRRVVRGV